MPPGLYSFAGLSAAVTKLREIEATVLKLERAGLANWNEWQRIRRELTAARDEQERLQRRVENASRKTMSPIRTPGYKAKK